MLQAMLIGNIGADAELKSTNGNEFVTFRVAHNESWTDAEGTRHETTMWVDCTINGKPRVFDFLKAGTSVFVMGRLTTRVYPSQKERCMKAGITISVYSIELLGGSSEIVPRRLYDEHGTEHQVIKYYHTDVNNTTLTTPRGQLFSSDENGWVFPLRDTQSDAEKNNESDQDNEAANEA